MGQSVAQPLNVGKGLKQPSDGKVADNRHHRADHADERVEVAPWRAVTLRTAHTTSTCRFQRQDAATLAVNPGENFEPSERWTTSRARRMQ
jgi:hypothetical protein